MFMIILCQNCGKEFEYSGRFKKKKFCSSDCLAQSAKERSKNNSNCGGDYTSQQSFITRYGKIKGIKKYNLLCAKKSKSNSGRTSPMKGRSHTEKTKKKIRKSVQNSQYHKGIRNKSYEEIHGEGSLNKLKENMQGVFNLEWFINKYGKKQGTIEYNNRVNNIKKTTYFYKYNKINKNNYSNKSQELFIEIDN